MLVYINKIYDKIKLNTNNYIELQGILITTKTHNRV